MTDSQNGIVEVAPRSEEECAVVLSAAYEEGWKIRIRGCGSWIDPDAPADLAISTRMLTGISEQNPADLLMSARAGTPFQDLQNAAAKTGTWIALDPPGGERSLGSVLATGTAGPVRTGYGPVKNRILGLTLITAEGRMLRVGGRVVKNVAGFDLTSLAVGSFGSFGVITSAHIQLHALPAVDSTLVATGSLHAMLEAAFEVVGSGVTPASLELVSVNETGSRDWTLAIRLAGSETTVSAGREILTKAVSGLKLDTIAGDAAGRFWPSLARGVLRYPATFRVGVLPCDVGTAIEQISAEFQREGEFQATVSVPDGVIRWSCDASIQQLQSLRSACAITNRPLTLERAPGGVLDRVGHYGAYPDGIGALVESLRDVFDSRRGIVVPLGDPA